MTVDSIRILIAEDHAVVREGTREILERDPSLAVVAEAEDGRTVLARCAEVRPDVVLLDLNLPVLNGIEVTRRLRLAAHRPRVLILSAYDDEDYVLAALSAGANGYLLKTAHATDVVAALHAVVRGEVVLDPTVATKVLARASGTERRGGPLSARELEVLRLAAKGARTREIAEALAVSPRTVEAHLTSVFNKLGVSTRTEAVARAGAEGWLTSGDRTPPEERQLP